MKANGLALLSLIAISLPVYGHHSDADYDRDAVVAFEGVITRFVWRNPHVTIFFDAEDEAGTRTEWVIETGSTPIMIRSGWSSDLLSPGDAVAVRMHPERSGRPRGILNTIETADGQLWMQIEEDPEETAAATSLDGVWRGLSIPGLFRRIREIALTPTAEEARATYDSEARDPSTECQPMPPPFFNLASSVYLTEIELLEDRVILRNELLDATRTVYTDGREHPQDGEYTLMGHSVGRWEDDVLVVDTRLFAENPTGNGLGGVPSSREKHVVERYSLTEDRTRAVVDVFSEDPVYLAEPFSGRIEMVYTPQLELYRYNCIPGGVE